jgi:LmbE family N-acetylglucosaminyl deacetylase
MHESWIAPGRRVLVIAAHPDDETLGCGGTIARLTRVGARVFVLAVVVGDMARVGGESRVADRVDEFSKACELLGVERGEVCWTDAERHMRLDMVPQLDLVRLIEDEAPVSLRAIKPDVVFMPAAGATNQDHVAVHQAALVVMRPHADALKPTPPVVLGYSIPEERSWASATVPATITVDTSRDLATKLAALEAYRSQAQPPGHPRFLGHVEELDRMAGYDAGVESAERFVPYRFVC